MAGSPDIRPSGKPRARGLSAVLAILLLATLPTGCDDERGTVFDPDQLVQGADGEFIFGATYFSAAVYRFQNAVIDTLSRVVTSGAGLPASFPAAIGSGQMTISHVGGITYSVDLENYNDPRVSPIFQTINGTMMIALTEASPGLRFTINPGDHLVLNFGPGPNQVVYALPPDFGDGAEVMVSGTTNGVLNNGSSAGFVRETGKVRMEERSQRFLLIEELALDYEYDASILPSFETFPVGRYEVGIFLGGTPSAPFRVTFHGDGLASYPYRGRTCQVNLDVPSHNIDAGNPCADL
jgi:hypothetical protein